MTAPRIAVVGGCHRDIVARTDARFEPGTSCPGVAVERPGGVARNVAVLLASAGTQVAFFGRVGDDDAGRALVASLATRGIDTATISIDPAVPTGTYLAVHDIDGELVAAVSSLAIYDRMAADTLPLGALAEAALVFADANLPAITLDALATALAPTLVVDAISRAKAPRILGALRAGALGFLNRPSAEALIGRAVAGPAEAASALASLGARRLVVTGGALPVALLDGGAVAEVAVPARPVVDVTGAGDALSAGTLAGLAAGLPLSEAVEIGILAAGAALDCVGALDRLPPNVLQALANATEPRP